MHQLPEPVLSEFQKGNFVVKRSAHKFNQVDPDQAMEWINGTGKKGGWHHEDGISSVHVDTLL